MTNRIKGLAFGALIILVVSAIGAGTASAAGDTDLTVNGSSSVDIGDQETYTVILEDGGDGVGGYNYNVSLSNGSVANIVDIEIGGNPDINTTNISSDGNSAVFDAGWIVGGMSGGTDLVIGTVTIEATTAGSTDLQVDSGASVIDPNTDSYTITNRNAQTIDVTVQKSDFQVSNLSAPSSADVGETVNVTADVTNNGTIQGTQNVAFRFNGSELGNVSVTLNASESALVDFSVDTTGVSPGDYTHGIFTDDDSETAPITITQSQPDFQVSNLDAPSSVIQGDTVTATATITNDGTADGTESVEFIFNGSVINSTSLSLAPGASQNVSLSADTGALSTGQFSVAVTAGNSQVSSQLRIADTDVSVVPSDTTTGVNQVQTFDIVLDNASDGTAGYEFTVELTNSTVASITGITTAGNPSLETINISNNSDSAYVDAGYLGNPVTGSQPLTIASVTVETKNVGSTDIAFNSSPLITDVNANQYVFGTINSAELSVTQSVTVPGAQGPAKDPDGDGLFEDVNGDGQLNSIDAVLLFQKRKSPAVKNNVALFNFQDSDTKINAIDSVKLYQKILSS